MASLSSAPTYGGLRTRRVAYSVYLLSRTLHHVLWKSKRKKGKNQITFSWFVRLPVSLFDEVQLDYNNVSLRQPNERNGDSRCTMNFQVDASATEKVLLSSSSSINSTIPSTSTVAHCVDCLDCLYSIVSNSVTHNWHSSYTHSHTLLSWHCMHIWCNRCNDSSHQHIFVWFLHQNSTKTEQQPLPYSRKVLVLFTSSHWRHFLSSSFSPSAFFPFRLRSAACFFVAVEVDLPKWQRNNSIESF